MVQQLGKNNTPENKGVHHSRQSQHRNMPQVMIDG